MCNVHFHRKKNKKKTNKKTNANTNVLNATIEYALTKRFEEAPSSMETGKFQTRL